MPRRKIPTKAELIQLQKLYKTDEKIAERLGNVTPQLVAYWRRKKNIPKHSFPKFSREEIKELWERFGDDYRCGLELGISKAAFYNWRRRYGYMDRPAFLKLEQLELNLGGPGEAIRRRSHYGHQTLSQKVLAEKVGLDRVDPGQIIEVEPDLAMSPGSAGLVLDHFEDIGLNYVWNPNRIVLSLDHGSPDSSDNTAESHKSLREFARRQNIKYIYDFGEGLCHQLIVEKAHILPGQLAFGTDRRTSSYGCLGAFAVEVTPLEMASVWATGKLPLTVPATAKVIINGHMPPGVFAKDVILFVAGKLGSSGDGNRVIEFYGTTVTQMSISDRFTLTSLASGMGMRTAVVPFDSITRRYLLRRTNMPYRPALADKDAIYSVSYEFNIDQLEPQIACPHAVDNVVPVAEVEGTPLNQVVIGSDTSGRFDDLRVAADILKGKKINPEIRVIVYPGSRDIYLEALKKGLLRAFVEAGAVVMSPGCQPGDNNLPGRLAAGERCLATTGSNHRASMGSKEAEVFLASPATAASSALRGAIAVPTGYL